MASSNCDQEDSSPSMNELLLRRYSSFVVTTDQRNILQWTPPAGIAPAWQRTPRENIAVAPDISRLVSICTTPCSEMDGQLHAVCPIQARTESGQTRRGYINDCVVGNIVRRRALFLALQGTKADPLSRTELSKLDRLVKGKLLRSHDDTANGSWVVHRTFYVLQRLTCSAKLELFADSINESGIMDTYCSLDVEDKEFGSCGAWTAEKDCHILCGAVGNPPFFKPFLREVFETFDQGVRTGVGYCRIIMAPLRFAEEWVTSSSSPALIIARIAPGKLGFKPQRDFFFHTPSLPRPHINQPLAIIAWINEEYRRSMFTPEDIESAYVAWGLRLFGDINSLEIDRCTMSCLFPPATRSSFSVSHFFGVS